MFLSNQYIEVRPVCASKFVEMTNNEYSRDQVLKMQLKILKVLEFDLNYASVVTYFERFI